MTKDELEAIKAKTSKADSLCKTIDRLLYDVVNNRTWKHLL